MFDQARQIDVYQDIPIINGYASVPPNLESQKTSFPADQYVQTLIDQSVSVTVHHISLGGGQYTGQESRTGKQSWIRVPRQ